MCCSHFHDEHILTTSTIIPRSKLKKQASRHATRTAVFMRSKTHPRIKPITASWSSSHPITERGSARPHAVIQWEKRRLSQPTHTTSKEASSSGDVSDVTILSELGLAPRVAPSKQVLASVCYICILSPPGKFSRPFDS